jgi:hypothetical protein
MPLRHKGHAVVGFQHRVHDFVLFAGIFRRVVVFEGTHLSSCSSLFR